MHLHTHIHLHTSSDGQKITSYRGNQTPIIQYAVFVKAGAMVRTAKDFGDHILVDPVHECVLHNKRAQIFSTVWAW